jgi:hypothetical protein
MSASIDLGRHSSGISLAQKLVATYGRTVGHNLLHLGGHHRLIAVRPRPKKAKGQHDRERRANQRKRGRPVLAQIFPSRRLSLLLYLFEIGAIHQFAIIAHGSLSLPLWTGVMISLQLQFCEETRKPRVTGFTEE